MLLHYEGDYMGFLLYGGEEEFENEWSEKFEIIGCYNIVYLNQKGEVVYLSVEAPFGPDCILEMARWVEKNPLRENIVFPNWVWKMYPLPKFSTLAIEM